MAYNSKAAQDNDEGLRRLDLERAYAESQANRPASVGAPREATPAAPAAGSIQVPPAQPNAQGARGYATRVIAPHAPSRPGLTWRLERLIDEVSAFRNFAPERVEAIKDEAAKKPAEATAAYETVFQREVVPFKEKAVLSVPEAIRQNPDATVFAVRRGKELHYETRPKGGAEDLLHGALLESVPMRATPFKAPSEVFAAPRPQADLAPGVSAPAVDAVAEPQAAPDAPGEAPAPAVEDASSLDLEAGEEDNPFADVVPQAHPEAVGVVAAPVEATPSAPVGNEANGQSRFSRFRRP